ncbi:MAG: terminase family protein [Candidatus Thiodiazotropha endolucinida]
MKPSDLIREQLARLEAQENLISFTNYTFPDFQAGEHHKIIADKLEAVERGEIKRLMIFAPPRHTKSELASRRFPAWYLGRNPKNQLICSTYSGEFALDFGHDVKAIIDSDAYKNVFDARLAKDSKASNRFRTEEGGISVYVGVGGAITGRGAHIALIDDPFKNRQEADSEINRDNVWKWYTSTLRTRLMPGGAIILIMTRWHEDDLAGRLLERDGKKEDGGIWDVVSLKAIEDGKALWPEWYPLEALLEIKREISETKGSREWTAQYQQSPQPEDGSFFLRDWFNWYDQKPENLNYYICSDYAVTEDGGDYTEHGVFGIDPNDNIYVVDWWSGQKTADIWIDELLGLIKEYRPYCSFGESGPIKRAIEPFLIKRMRERHIYGRTEWIARNRDKASMARAFQARAAAGKVYLPRNNSGHELLDQLLRFPVAKHDDKVDVCALMGLALDEAHPAVVPNYGIVGSKRFGGYEFQHEEDNSWKLN